jgi:alpha-L-arabinofuranosidase
MFTLKGMESDGFIASWMGAMYLSDLLMNLSRMPDLLMANHWSLIGNWYFGALGLQGEERPAFYVLQAFNELMHGHYLHTVTASPGFESPEVGFAPAQKNVPFVNTISTFDDGKIRMLVLNKHPMASASVKVSLKGYSSVSSVDAKALSADSIFHYDSHEAKVKTQNLRVEYDENHLNVVLPPHSLAIITIN